MLMLAMMVERTPTKEIRFAAGVAGMKILIVSSDKKSSRKDPIKGRKKKTRNSSTENKKQKQRSILKHKKKTPTPLTREIYMKKMLRNLEKTTKGNKKTKNPKSTKTQYTVLTNYVTFHY